MGRTPRREVVDQTAVGVYHCFTRCVRRAFLCGEDPLTGMNFDHRRDWIQQQLEFLAGICAIDVLGFSLMSNHIHLTIRNRPDIAAEWSDDEVARRWWKLHPGRRTEDGQAANPEPHELQMLKADGAALAERRRRLSCISWFMRSFAEPIARRANAEDKCTGRYFEERFKCQHLLDDAAILACVTYVELNPIRAGVATTPEKSKFTSAFERIAAQKESQAAQASPVDIVVELPAVTAALVVAEECRTANSAEPQTVVLDSASGTHLASPPAQTTAVHPESYDHSAQSEVVGACPLASNADRQADSARSNSASRDAWLSPVELNEQQHTAPKSARNGRRASDLGFLPLRQCEYFQLLDWTGRQPRNDKPGMIPEHLATILDRLGIVRDSWVALVQDFGRRFRTAAGCASSLAQEAARRGRRWLHGAKASRLAFV